MVKYSIITKDITIGSLVMCGCDQVNDPVLLYCVGVVKLMIKFSCIMWAWSS